MKKYSIWLKILIPALFIVFLTTSCYQGPTPSQQNSTPAQQTETVADRVLRTKKIRAGYAVVSPAVIKDPNTKELSGIFIDTMREIGRRLSLEVEFTEEVGWSEMIAGLNAGRYEIISTQVWPNAARSREAAFSEPLYYTPIGIYVRANEHRFDNNIAALNSESIRVGGIDGASSLIIGSTDFPLAKQVKLPGNAQTDQQFLDVVAGKADVVFLDTFQGEEFIKNNPNSLRNLVPDRPIRVFPDTFMVKRDEYHFLNMINTTLGELDNSGFLDKTIDKYAGNPKALARRAHGYRLTH